MEKKYYFISYGFAQKRGLLDQEKRLLAGESCECTDRHPFEFLKGKVAEGFVVTIKFFCEITKSEYDLFYDVISGK